MRVALDLRGLQTAGRLRGVGVLWRELLRELAVIDTVNQYYLIYVSGHPSSDDEIHYPENFKKVTLHTPFSLGRWTSSWLWLSGDRRFHALLRRLKPDLFVDTTFHDFIFPSQPSPSVKSLIWIYDLIPWSAVEPVCHRGRRPGLMRLIHNIFTKRKLQHAVRHDAVIAISEATRQDLHRKTGYPLTQISIVQPGVDLARYDAATTDRQTLRQFLRLPDHYLLYVGALAPHKNLLRVLQAYNQASGVLGMPPLLIVGKIAGYEDSYAELQKEVARLALAERICFLDWVPDECLPALYAQADFFLFPSLYEGFGLPVLEAMAAGCPVLTSNTTSLPEVVGDCAQLVDPHRTESIAEGLVRLASDQVFRKQLGEKGRIRASQFSWRHTATDFRAKLEGFPWR